MECRKWSCQRSYESAAIQNAPAYDVADAKKYIDGDPSNDECAINDTGIVYSDRGPYIFVIYTDHPFGVFKDYATENPLYELAEKAV